MASEQRQEPAAIHDEARRSVWSRTLARRAFVILGMSGLAVTQPLLDVFGNNPEFFVAGNYSSGQIIWFALIVTVLPPLLGIAVVAAAAAASHRAGTIAFAVVVAVFAVALVLVIVRTLGLNPIVLVIGLTALGGAALALVVVRTQGGRLFASYLAVANLAFVGLFLFGSPTSDLLAGATRGDLGEISVPELAGPVVVIVLDEFPAATIMRADGTINGDRFPGFADLASTSTWFRNASSRYHLTHRSVPSILDGTVGDEGALPIYDDHPRNLFTLVGGDVPVYDYESVTDLCPETICEPPDHQPLTQMLEDASIVYGHRVLPGALRDTLPAIDNSWGAYGADEAGGGGTNSGSDGESSPAPFIEQAYSRWRGLDADESSPLGQAAILRDQIDAISAEPALHFVHVAIPHRPWLLSRTGISTSFLPDLIRDPADPAYAFESRMEFQLHSMQSGAADALLGELLDALRSLPSWDDALIVVTSDHGTNLTAPDIGRMRITDENREQVYRIPLFIKAPGQTAGEISDDSAQTIDVLPSIVDLLDAEVDWTFDGHSLYDGSEATIPPLISVDVQAVLDIAERRSQDFPYGDDWIGLAAVGDNGELVGREVDEFPTGDHSEFTLSFEQADLFEQLPTDTGQAPFALHGTVVGPGRPPELLVAINGRFAGVLGGYRPDGDEWTFLGYVADLYRAGANEVSVYEVERDGDDVTLHSVSADNPHQ